MLDGKLPEKAARVDDLVGVDFKILRARRGKEFLNGGLQVSFQRKPLFVGHQQGGQDEDGLLSFLQIVAGISRLVEVDEMHGLGVRFRRGQAEGADDLRFAGLVFLFHQTEATLFMEGDGQFGKLVIFDPKTELAVQGVGSYLAKGVTVDVFDGLAEVVGVEEGAFDSLGVAVEARIGTEPSAGGAAEGAADGFFLAQNRFDCFRDQGVVIGLAGQCRGIRGALGRLKDLELRLRDDIGVRVEPDEGVVVLGGAHVGENARPSGGNLGTEG